MDEYVTKEQVIDWFRTYGHMDEPIPFETMVSDLRDMPAADVAPVVHGRWICIRKGYGEYECSVCHGMDSNCSDYYSDHVVTEQEYCPFCGAKMDGGANNEAD